MGSSTSDTSFKGALAYLVSNVIVLKSTTNIYIDLKKVALAKCSKIVKSRQ